MGKRLDALFGDKEISGFSRRFLSLSLLAFAGAIALFGQFEGRTWYFTTKTFTIAPTLISGVLGFALLVPLYLRGILRFRFSIFGLLSFVVLALIFSSFVEIAVGSGFGQSLKTYLVLIAVLLSWLGMRGVAAMAWLLVVFAVFLSMQSTSNAMGLWGWSFLASSIIGLLLNANMGPKGLIRSLRNEYIEGNYEVQADTSHEAIEEKTTLETHHKQGQRAAQEDAKLK